MSLWKIVRCAIGIVALGLLVGKLVQSSSYHDWQHVTAHPILFLGAAAGALLSVVLQFILWFFLVNRGEPCLAAWPAYERFSVSALSKYLPLGQLLQYAAFLDASGGQSLRLHCMGSLMLSTLGGWVAGTLIILAGIWTLPGLSKALPVFLFILVILAMVAVWISRGMPSGWISRWIPCLPSLRDIMRRIRLRDFAALVLVQFVFCWIAEGLAIVCLLRMAGVSLSPVQYVASITTYALAFFVGSLVPISPAGMGVREGVWLFLLGHTLTVFPALFVPLGMRFLLTFADAVLVFPFFISRASVLIKKRPDASGKI